MADDLSKLDDDTQYRVKLSKAITLPELQVALSPSTDNVVKGRVLKSFPAEAVAAVEEA